MDKYVEGTGIKDSGERQEFPSGALRDLEKGKGNFDLLPCWTLGILSMYKLDSKNIQDQSLSPKAVVEDAMYKLIGLGMENDFQSLCKATRVSLEALKMEGESTAYHAYLHTYHDSEIEVQYLDYRDFSQLPYEGLRKVAEHFRLGALKYSPRNWEKGISLSRFRSSAMRHMFQYLNGMDDEPHLEAAVWNLFCYIEIYCKMASKKLSSEYMGNETIPLAYID